MRPRSMSTVLAALSRPPAWPSGPALRDTSSCRLAVGQHLAGTSSSLDRRSCSLRAGRHRGTRTRPTRRGSRRCPHPLRSLPTTPPQTVRTGRVDRLGWRKSWAGGSTKRTRRLRHTFEVEALCTAAERLARLHLVLERIDQRRGRVATVSGVSNAPSGPFFSVLEGGTAACRATQERQRRWRRSAASAGA